MLVDSHCHLNWLDLSLFDHDLSRVITRAKENDVQYLLNVATDLKTFSDVLATAKAYDNVFASVGLHPNEEITEGDSEPDANKIAALAQDEKVVAIGETGLDYYRSSGNLAWQHQRFRAHIQAAKQINKPLIVHNREASEDIIRILSEENAADVGGVMHCFADSWEIAEQAMGLNFYISFSGIITFKSAENLREIAKQVPLDRLLIETDSPYLAPVPYRGKPNEPAYVRYVAECLADVRNISLEEVAHHTTQNFFELFKCS